MVEGFSKVYKKMREGKVLFSVCEVSEVFATGSICTIEEFWVMVVEVGRFTLFVTISEICDYYDVDVCFFCSNTWIR